MDCDFDVDVYLFDSDYHNIDDIVNHNIDNIVNHGMMIVIDAYFVDLIVIFIIITIECYL